MRSVIPDVIHHSRHLIWLFFIFFVSLKHDGGGVGCSDSRCDTPLSPSYMVILHFFMSLKHDGGGEGDLSLNQQYHNFHLVAKSGNGEGLRIS